MMAGKHSMARQSIKGSLHPGHAENSQVPVPRETKRAKMAANKTSAANNPPFDVPSW